MALSYATDIKPLFTDLDHSHMLQAPSFARMDLWSYADVKKNASRILSAVQSGIMPPDDSGEQPWDQTRIDTFQQWINEGYPP
jgi:hypothetical protein